MALKRRWMTIKTVSEIPVDVRDNDRYSDKDWWLDTALITDDRLYTRLSFDDGSIDLWKSVRGTWELVQTVPASGTDTAQPC